MSTIELIDVPIAGSPLAVARMVTTATLGTPSREGEIVFDTDTSILYVAVDDSGLGWESIEVSGTGSAYSQKSIATMSSDQSETSAVVEIEFDTEVIDGIGVHSDFVGTPRWVIPESGVYLVTTQIDFQTTPEATGRHLVSVTLYNSSTAGSKSNVTPIEMIDTETMAAAISGKFYIDATATHSYYFRFFVDAPIGETDPDFIILDSSFVVFERLS